MRSDQMKLDPGLEAASCPFGCEEGEAAILSGVDRLHNLPGVFAVVKCLRCGLMRTSPRPTAEAMGQYYPDDYGPYLSTQSAPEKSLSGFVARIRPMFRWCFNDRSHYLPKLAAGRMLEIGCASGAFLREMSEKGWQVEGIEFSEAPAKSARALGFRVQTGALERAAKPESSVDLVVGWMVLEHLHDPVACLSRLNEWSTPGAYLVISVPNAASLEFRLFKEKWYSLHLPAHLFHFTPDTLSRLLRLGGWKVEKVFHHRSFANLLMSTAYSLEPKGWPKLARIARASAWPTGTFYYLTFPFAWLFAAFGQTGRMTVWATKIYAEPGKTAGVATAPSGNGR